MSKELLNTEYSNWIKTLKTKIREAQNKVAFTINSELLELYWELGRELTLRQKDSGWGSKYMEATAKDLRDAFPQIKGFSRRNLYAMRQWYQFYSQESEFVPQGVAKIPWGHNRLIVSKIKDLEAAKFYTREIIQNGWDRDTLEIQIGNQLYQKVGKAVNNFEAALPKEQSKLANEVLKDPYNFDFLGLESDALEKAVEDELVKNITKFLLELGKGFAFMGRQYKIEISETDYFIDLLFYHVELRCYIVIELKAGKFKPEHAGKLNFYLSAVDTQIKSSEDNLTIGILLCKKKDKIEAEYALRDINKPMGISEYRLTEVIPESIKSKLPSIEELESKLGEIENKND